MINDSTSLDVTPNQPTDPNLMRSQDEYIRVPSMQSVLVYSTLTLTPLIGLMLSATMCWDIVSSLKKPQSHHHSPHSSNDHSNRLSCSYLATWALFPSTFEKHALQMRMHCTILGQSRLFIYWCANCDWKDLPACHVDFSHHMLVFDPAHTENTACTDHLSVSNALQSPAEARLASDATAWVAALVNELDNLDKKRVIQWSQPWTAPTTSRKSIFIAYIFKTRVNEKSIKRVVPTRRPYGTTHSFQSSTCSRPDGVQTIYWPPCCALHCTCLRVRIFWQYCSLYSCTISIRQTRVREGMPTSRWHLQALLHHPASNEEHVWKHMWGLPIHHWPNNPVTITWI